MFDPDRVYTSSDVRSNIYFTSHSDMPGVVELFLPGFDRSLKLSAAAAEDLTDNLIVNTEAARRYARMI